MVELSLRKKGDRRKDGEGLKCEFNYIKLHQILGQGWKNVNIF